MNAIKKARRLITVDPQSPESLILAQLVLALESEQEFPLTELYALDLEVFDLAIEILKEWRLDRYYARKGKLLDVSYQVGVLASH